MLRRTPKLTLYRTLTVSLLAALLLPGCNRDGGTRPKKVPTAAPSVVTIGSRGSGPARFNNPDGVAVDGAGNIWVVDDGNNRIQVLSSSGVFMFQFGSKGIGPGRFLRLSGIWLAHHEVYITDEAKSRVQVFDQTGRFQRFLYAMDNGKNLFNTPLAIRSYRKELYVVDQKLGAILVLDRLGTVRRQIPLRSERLNRLIKPESIAVDSSGQLWIAEEGASRVHIFRPDGTPVATIGPRIGTKYTINGDVEGITCHNKLCYVVDEAGGYVLAFNQRGAFQFYLGKGTGHAPGQLFSPDGMAYHPTLKRLVVVDQGNSRLQLFSLEPQHRRYKLPTSVIVASRVKPFVVARMGTHLPQREIRKYLPLAHTLGARLSDFGFTGGSVAVFRNSEQLSRALKQGRVHLLVESPYISGLMLKQGLARPLVIGKKKGHWLYRSLIVVRRDSGITSLAQLVGKTMAAENPLSTSSYLLPRAMLKLAGLTLVPFGSKVDPKSVIRARFVQDRRSAAWWILKKGLSGGFFAGSDFKALGDKSNLKVLARSPLVPRLVLSLRQGENQELALAVLQALQTLGKRKTDLAMRLIKVTAFRRVTVAETNNILKVVGGKR